MQLADIEPGLHVIWDDSPSVETRNNLIRKIDAFHHRTFPSKFERFALLLQDDAACLKGGVSGMIYCDWLHVDGLWVDDGLRHRGIGTELMIRAENHAIARGCHSVWLKTSRRAASMKQWDTSCSACSTIIPLAKISIS